MAINAENNNSGLYFIVGALFVAVLVIGAMFYYDGDNTESNSVTISPAAGPDVTQPDGQADTSSSTTLKFDEDGVSATTTTKEDKE